MKSQVNKLLESKPELDIGKNKEYKLKVIKDSAIYTTKATKDQFPRLYYFISWKSYSGDKST